MSLLSVDGLVARHGLLEAVCGVQFRLEAGETLAIVGANGAGKTTLLRAIAGAHPIAAGTVSFRGEDVTALPAHRRTAAGLALVPEGRRLFGQMTVEENLMLGRFAGRTGSWTVERVMDAFPNLKERRRAKCSHLSGGEQQATAIGRALMTNPELLILDEVSLGLSPLIVDRVYEQIDGLVREGTTIILVEQNLSRALEVASNVICMLEGQIVLAGAAGTLSRDDVTNAYFGLGRVRAHGGTP
ncbi:MAG: ABC transporter ATP-binding protein [Ancalomicrobiaceae bacterium]|nr:ABC transporter ATP-binding protein [Ancalomicrobiaceae bacterium]